jgi:hypothetical protein
MNASKKGKDVGNRESFRGEHARTSPLAKRMNCPEKQADSRLIRPMQHVKPVKQADNAVSR